MKFKYTLPMILACCFFMTVCSKPQKVNDVLKNEAADTLTTGDSIDQATGLVVDDALPVVIGNCTGCHSAQLIIQNRATREGWKSMIVWMQQTQNLWDLGKNEEVILDYLAAYYAPEATGRRRNLDPIEWYDLKE